MNVTANELPDTSCWRCSWLYDITLLMCPKCGAANANVDPEAAKLQMEHDDKQRRSKP